MASAANDTRYHGRYDFKETGRCRPDDRIHLLVCFGPGGRLEISMKRDVRFKFRSIRLSGLLHKLPNVPAFNCLFSLRMFTDCAEAFD